MVSQIFNMQLRYTTSTQLFRRFRRIIKQTGRHHLHWFGIIIYFARIQTCFLADNTLIFDKAEVSVFVTLSGKPVLLAVYFHPCPSPCNIPICLALLPSTFWLSTSFFQSRHPQNSGELHHQHYFLPSTQSHSDLKTASFYHHQQAINLPTVAGDYYVYFTVVHWEEISSDKGWKKYNQNVQAFLLQALRDPWVSRSLRLRNLHTIGTWRW
jgi:hypothetical protein